MRLRVARWRDSRGSSAGCWLICELPGAMAHRSGLSGTWALVISATLYDLHPRDPERVWGRDFQTGRAQKLLEEHPHLAGEFRTRSQLLASVDQALLAPRSALSELVSL